MYDEVARMTKMFLSDSIAIFNMLDNNEMKEASRRNVAYFSVALELFILEEQDSNFVDDLMAPELANIDSSLSDIIFNNFWYTMLTIPNSLYEDITQIAKNSRTISKSMCTA